MLTDEEREREIKATTEQMNRSTDPQERRALWNRLRGLINGRSPAAVARMELEKGLVRPKAA